MRSSWELWAEGHDYDEIHKQNQDSKLWVTIHACIYMFKTKSLVRKNIQKIVSNLMFSPSDTHMKAMLRSLRLLIPSAT